VGFAHVGLIVAGWVVRLVTFVVHMSDGLMAGWSVVAEGVKQSWSFCVVCC